MWGSAIGVGRQRKQVPPIRNACPKRFPEIHPHNANFQVTKQRCRALGAERVGEKDYRAEGVLDILFGRVRFSADLIRHRFLDAGLAPVSESKRELQEGSAKYLLTRDFAISLRYRMDRQDQIFQAPKLPYHQRTRFWDALAEGKLGRADQFGLPIGATLTELTSDPTRPSSDGMPATCGSPTMPSELKAFSLVRQ